MRAITRTIYSAALQTAQFFNIEHEIRTNTTLNERFGVEPNTLPAEDKYPQLKYVAIGNRGHQVVEGAEGIPYTAPRRHAATDAACFNHIPFVLRRLSDDLPGDRRARYALRREEEHDGTTYVAYYLKRMDVDDIHIEMNKTYIDEGEQVSESFTPTEDNLSPSPVEPVSSDEIVSSSGEYVSASALISVQFDEQDVEELKNVAEILYGSSQYAVVSEIALCTGVDHTSTGPGPGGGEIDYEEAIGVQVACFISDFYQLDLQNQGFTLDIDNGITEPLFAVTSR